MIELITDDSMDLTRESALIHHIIDRPHLLNNIDVTSRHFFNIKLGQIFDCISSMFDSDKRITLSTVNTAMDNKWAEDELLEVLKHDSTDTVQTISKSMLNAHTRRQLDFLARGMLEDNQTTNNGNTTALTYIDKLTELASDKESETLHSSKHDANVTLDIILNNKKPQLIRTGIVDLDRMTGGVAKGLLTVVGALSGMGKTAFLANIYYNTAKQGNKVLFFSLEDDTHKIHMRIISRLSRVQSKRLTQYENLSFEDANHCRNAVKKIDFEQCYIDDSIGQTTQKIRRKVKRLIAEHGIDLVVVDHGGELVRGSDVYNKTSDVFRELRDIALDTGVGMLVASQLSRSVLDNVDNIPAKNNLRNSGVIEEVARAIWLLHRPCYFDKSGQDDGKLWIIIDKATHGSRGRVEVDLDLDHMEINSKIGANNDNY